MIIDNKTILKLKEIYENHDQYGKAHLNEILLVIYGKKLEELLKILEKGNIIINES